MRRVMFRYKTHLARGLTACIDDEVKLDQWILAERLGQLVARIVVADGTDEYATSAESYQIASDVSGTPDHQFRALDDDDRRRSFRRNPRDVPINKFIQHQIADAEHGLIGKLGKMLVEIVHAVTDNDPRG